MTLGKRIQALRKEAGLSQDALGERLGVTRQAVSRWEADGTVPEVDNLIAMARLFHITVDELLCGARSPEEPAGEAPAGRKLSRAFAALWARRPAWMAGRPDAFWRLAAALTACGALLLAVAVLAGTNGSLRRQRRQDLQQIASLEATVDSQARTIAHLQSLLEHPGPTQPEEPELIGDWTVTVLGPDLESGNTRYGFSAQLSTLREGAGAFFILDGGEGHTVELPAPPDRWNRCTAEAVLPAVEGGYVLRMAVEEEGVRRVETLREAPLCADYVGGGTEDQTWYGPFQAAVPDADERLDGREAYLVDGTLVLDFPLDLNDDGHPVAVPRSAEFQILRQATRFEEEQVLARVPVELTVARDAGGVWRATGSADIHSRVDLPDPGKQVIGVGLTVRAAAVDQFGTTYVRELWRSHLTLSGNRFTRSSLTRNKSYPAELTLP